LQGKKHTRKGGSVELFQFEGREGYEEKRGENLETLPTKRHKIRNRFSLSSSEDAGGSCIRAGGKKREKKRKKRMVRASGGRGEA